MGKIRGVHSSPGIYTLITNIKKQSKTRIGLVGNNTGGYTPNNSPGGNKPIVNKYLTFTALEGNCAIGFYNNPDSSIVPTIEYSFDKNTWNTLTEDKVIIPQNTNMYCRGLNPDGISGGYDESGYNYFIGEGKFNVSGDIMSLIDYNTMPETMVGTFYNLFGGNIDTSREDFVDIVDASKLVLSAKVLTSDCYQRMFSACTSMTHGPQIKAEVLAPYCCWGMFIECTSLVTAPELPATTLANSCYYAMFANCTSLTEAPELPATTLARACYYDMFANCTSLTEAPKLPATTLTDYCYEIMFESCTSLTEAPKLPATTLAKGCYSNMFYNCTSLTTAHELPATELADGCYESMFSNCTSLTQAPELPATTLADGCYRFMFYSCTSLTQAPELPATTLANSCYQYMFNTCISLTAAPELPATTLEYGCYEYMFSNCTSLTEAPELPATELAEGCYSNMFNTCTSLTEAPELPATELAEGCYRFMFYSCTSLTQAPELPATTLTEKCYNNMFHDCTNLNHIKCLATDISAYDCTEYWVEDVSEIGTFVKHPDMNDWTRGIHGIPIKWNLEDAEIPYVTFTAQEDGSSIGLARLSTNQTMEYSTDTATWNTFDTETNISLNNGESAYVRGVLSADNTDSNYTQFKMSGKIAASGNCNTLWNYQDLNTPLKAYCGKSMFNGCISLTIVPELRATTLSNSCYWGMFAGCTSLTTTPELPATELASECYYAMFNGCTSLTTVPELPATTLAIGCYQSMFSYCTSLTTAQELPATVLSENCYYGMFYHCESLTAAPELPATELASGCYHSMFSYCTSLTTAPELPATTLVDNCYVAMFYGCSSLTDTPELPATELVNRCYVNMFRDCTSLTTAPELPATELTDSCYNSMFLGCTSLTTVPGILPATELANSCYGWMFEGCSKLTVAPELPANTLTEKCYEYMFRGCKSLNYIKCLATDISASGCTYYWVDGVSSTGTFVKHPDMNDWKIDSVDDIPIGWTPEDVDMPYVTFTAQEDNSSVGLAKLSTNQTMEYSTDTTTWNTFDTTTNITLTNVGDKVYVRGMLSADNGYNEDSESYNNTQFKMTGKIAASGNCNTIWNYEDLNAPLKERCGFNMFYNCTSLTTAPELPATTLAKACYCYMFGYCTSLITAPELPATTLANSCYNDMFASCTSLTTAPELPATTLTNWCYSGMFMGCTSLTAAPELPATELADYCYGWMFDDCVSLTTAPELPAMELATSCYTGMFTHCSSLTTAPKLPATTLAHDCYGGMFQNCTSLTTAPELPATTLSSSCYYNMFQNCTSLTTAPELHANTLVSECYYVMFRGCTNLNYIKCMATNISAYNCTSGWVKDVSETGTFIRRPYIINWSTGSNGIPSGWVVEDAEMSCVTFTAQEDNSSIGLEKLSTNQTLEYSTDRITWNTFDTTTNITLNNEESVYVRGVLNGDNTDSNYTQFKMSGKIAASGNCNAIWNYHDLNTPLKTYCGYYMFKGCYSLTIAPELPATELAEWCYAYMFQGCTSLNKITCLATDISVDYCIYNYVERVSSTGTFIKHPDMNDWTTGTSGIPEGWIIEDADLPYVIFTAEEDNSSIGLAKLSTYQTLEYSTDTTTWNTFDTESNISLNNGDKVYIRGVLIADNTDSNYTQFKMTGKIAASGNCNAIWEYRDLNAPLKQYCGFKMFGDCISLTLTPELPATELAFRCYAYMFRSCSSLTTAPEILPSTTLASSCYQGMFSRCTSLTSATVLPATTLVGYCYSEMFYNCNKLNHITCLATDISAGKCTQYWVEGVSSTGTFVKHPDMNNWTTDTKGIPSGWVVENYTE